VLCENIDPRRHYCYLRSKLILSSDDQERIDSGQTRRDRACRLIDILITKGPTAFDELCDSIREERTQIFLLELLHKALENELGTYRRNVCFPVNSHGTLFGIVYCLVLGYISALTAQLGC